jgi:hypothetical protein
MTQTWLRRTDPRPCRFSTTYRIATGLHTGHQIAKIGGGFCVAGRGGGFRLNAATRCRAGNRHRLAPQ